MNQDTVGSGGFFLPRLFTKNNAQIIDTLKKGEIDYADLSQWSFTDEFLCFTLQIKLLEYMDTTYPNPRKKNDVPIWFLIASQFVLRLHNHRAYHQLPFFLNAGSVLTKIGCNTSTHGNVGFNDKNKYERTTAVDHDTVRKFFKDTNHREIRNWYNETLQSWFRGRKVYDAKGLFILDLSHLVVPDNTNYEDAVRLPVDSHGQWYKNLSNLTDEQKKVLVHHPCYALSCLLHVNTDGDLYHISGYELGPGNDDELEHAQTLVPAFCRNHPGVMKELIVDRGYISGPFIGTLKKDFAVDVLVPLRKNMDDYKDACAIASRKKNWTVTECDEDDHGVVLKKTVTTVVENMKLWDACPVSLHAYVSKTRRWDTKKQSYEEYVWVLASTKKYPSEKAAIERYGLRTQVEERFKQLKCYWHIGKFTSPARGLIESHVCFILLTYSLLQLYLRRKQLRDLAHRTIETLRREERLGKDVVIVYSGSSFGVLNLDDYSIILMELEPEPKQKLKNVMTTQKEVRLRREQNQ